MDYIIFNSDGSIKEKKIKQYIQQGSSGVNQFFIGYHGALESDYCQAVFTLPNHQTNTVLGSFEEQYGYEPNKKEDGWIITLTSDQTTYGGLLFVAIRIIRDVILVNYPFALVINETGVKPDTDSGVTIEELDSYLANLQLLVEQSITNAVQENTDGELSETSLNPVQNRVITANLQNVREVAEGKCKAIVISYSTTAPTTDEEAQALKKANGTPFTDLADFNNYVEYDGYSGLYLNPGFNSNNSTVSMPSNSNEYLITVDGFVLRGQDDYGLKLGDIIFVIELDVPDRWWYPNGDNAYKLETAKVDLTNFYTKSESDGKYVALTGNQAIAGNKNFTGTTKFNEVSDGHNTVSFSSLISGRSPIYKHTITIGSHTEKLVILNFSGIVGSHTLTPSDFYNLIMTSNNLVNRYIDASSSSSYADFFPITRITANTTPPYSGEIDWIKYDGTRDYFTFSGSTDTITDVVTEL